MPSSLLTDLDPLPGLSQFKDINDNVIVHLVHTQGVKVTVRLEIEANHADRFDMNVARTVRENANTFSFKKPASEND